MKNDIRRFIAGLEGADEEELALMLVVANSIRLKLLDEQKISPAALDFAIPRDHAIELECDMNSVFLANLIKIFQKSEQFSDATGAMIWLHSVRALNVPELRILGREMWGQLERGFPLVDDALLDFAEPARVRLPLNISEELKFIPRGLEPRATSRI